MNTPRNNTDPWVIPRLLHDEFSKLSEEGHWSAEQLEVLENLMSIRGFAACYLVNYETSVRSAIIGNRADVCESQLAVVAASLKVQAFDHLALSLEYAHILVRRVPNLPGQVCAVVIDRDTGNPTLAMAAMKNVCDSLR